MLPICLGEVIDFSTGDLLKTCWREAWLGLCCSAACSKVARRFCIFGLRTEGEAILEVGAATGLFWLAANRGEERVGGEKDLIILDIGDLAGDLVVRDEGDATGTFDVDAAVFGEPGRGDTGLGATGVALPFSSSMASGFCDSLLFKAGPLTGEPSTLAIEARLDMFLGGGRGEALVEVDVAAATAAV